jgi:hypothetical protein
MILSASSTLRLPISESCWAMVATIVPFFTTATASGVPSNPTTTTLSRAACRRKLPVAADSFARFARSSYLRATRRCRTTAASRCLRANSSTRHRAGVSVARVRTAALFRFVVDAASVWPRCLRCAAPPTDHRAASLARSSSQIFRCWRFGKSASFSPGTHIGAPAFRREATSWSGSCWRE